MSHTKNQLYFGRGDVDESVSESESMSAPSSAYNDAPYGESSYAEGYTPGFENGEGQEYLYSPDGSGGTGTVEDVEQAMSYYDQSKVDSITLNHVPPNLVRWNYAAAALQFLSCGALIYFTLEHTDEDAQAHVYTNLPSSADVTEQPSYRQLFSFSMGWYSVWFVFFSAINHVLVSTVFRDPYEFYISRNQNTFRWWEFAITTPLMRIMVAQLVGVTDLQILFGIYFLTSINMLLGMVHESVNEEARAFRQRPQNWSVYTLSWFPLLASWIPTFWYFLDSFLSSQRPQPALYVVILVPVIFCMDLMVHLLFWLMWSDSAPWKEYSYVNYEKGFIFCSLLQKATLAWLYFGGEMLT